MKSLEKGKEKDHNQVMEDNNNIKIKEKINLVTEVIIHQY